MLDLAEVPPRRRRLLLLAVVGLGAAFRLHRLAPPGLWGDDAVNGLIALDILDGHVTSPFALVTHAASHFHALSNYGIAAAFWALGPSLESLRLAGALLGIACVPLLYATVAPLFGARTALLAATVFATSPVQVAHAKILVQDVTGETMLLLATALLAHGTEGRRRWLIAVAGAPLGLALCTYHAFKIAPLVAVAWLALLVWRRPSERRALAAWGAALGVVLLLTAAPGLLAYAEEPSALTGRIAGTFALGPASGGGLEPLLQSIWRTLAIFHYQQGPVLQHWFGIGTDPALAATLAFLMLAGLVQSVARRREPRHALLLAWFALGLLPGMLSDDAPRVYRILPATPVVYVWAALPLAQLFSWSRTGHRPARALATLAGLLLAGTVLLDYNTTFVRTYSHPSYLWAQAARIVDMAQTLAERGPGWRGYLLSPSFDHEHETLRFLGRVWSLDMRSVSSLADLLPVRDDGDVLLMFDTGALPMAAAVRELYPAAVVERHYPPRQRQSLLDELRADAPNETATSPMAGYIALDQSAQASVRGLDAVYLDAAATPLAREIWASPTRPAIAVDSSTLLRATHVIAGGSIYVPEQGEWRFRLPPASGGRVLLDGMPLLDGDRPEATAMLAEGLHPLTIVWEPSHGSPPDLKWQRPGQPWRRIPAALVHRDTRRRGWEVEHGAGEPPLRRREPMPWTDFFTAVVPGSGRSRWRGTLEVPAGGRRLEIRSRGDLTVLVDGTPWSPRDRLAAGEHAVEIVVDNRGDAHLLELHWREALGRRRVPSSAFRPPPPASGADEPCG